MRKTTPMGQAAAQQGPMGQAAAQQGPMGQAAAQQGPMGQPAAQQGEPQGQPVPVPVVLEKIANLYHAGRLKQAHALCSRLLQQRPRLADAHGMMGVVLLGLGQEEQARKALKNAIRFHPTGHYYSNLGELEREAGNLDDAEKALKKAIGMAPDYPQAYNNLGIVYFEKAEFEKAVEAYKKSLKLKPDYAEVHNNIGNAYRALKENALSMEHYEKAMEYREDYPEAYNNIGSALRAEERFDEAEFCYKKAISLNPKYSEAANNLAVLYMSQDNYDEALRVLDDTLKAGNHSIPLYLTIARVQMEKGNFDSARKACDMALVEDPKCAEAYTIRGQIFHDLDLYSEAVEAFEKAIELEPDYAEARNFFGIALKSLGRLDEAREQFITTIEKHPSAIGAYSNIADLVKFRENPELLEGMKNILKESETPDSDRFMGLHFALGKAYDDLGQYKEAFEHFSTGARMKRKHLDYKEDDIGEFFEHIKKVFNKEFFENRIHEGNPTELPVFVIGMPRSGSTLTEQIISSHPQAYGAGEIKTFSRAIGTLKGRFPTLPKFPDLVNGMKPNHFKMVADFYLDYLNGQKGDEIRVTDKLLTNYYFVGLLWLLFPNAKFIHTRRNPIDTCLSAYTKLFKDDMPHSYELRELGRYYKRYASLMDHWHKVLPEGVLIDSVYEDVVNDTETQAKRLIRHCGLKWDSACLDFHKSKRPIKTASVAQVRKPVYTSSLERWKRYENELQPLIEELGEP